MPNHHEKDLTAVLVSIERAQKALLSATLAEGYPTVKQQVIRPHVRRYGLQVCHLTLPKQMLQFLEPNLL